ncbi:MAG: serine/threonine-protein kinase [Cyanobacteria bacterium P01_A01_bin.84]
MLLNSRYQVVRTLGSGGFGETFLAEDTQMPSGRKCVVKQLKPIKNNPQIYQLVQERFQREAAILEDLGGSSEQIPTLYAYFQSDEQFYLVQQYVQGKTLTEAVREKGLFSENQVREILASLLPVLEYVHSMRIVHRDIKPDNIILRIQDSQPVLIDFGAVRETMGTVVNSQGSPTSSIVIGTPGYMPSEQAMGRPTYASDLYSLGMSAIYLLTGKQPQELQTDPNTGEFIWRQYANDASIEMADILEKAIAYHPRERFPSAKAMLEALQNSAATLPPTIPPKNINISTQPITTQSSTDVHPSPTIPQYIATTSQPSSNQISISDNGIKGIIIGCLIAGSIIGASIIVGMALNKPSFENSQAQNQKRTATVESGNSNIPNNSQITDERTLTTESVTSQSNTAASQNKPFQNNTISPQPSNNTNTNNNDTSQAPVKKTNNPPPVEKSPVNQVPNDSPNTNRQSPTEVIRNYYTAINQGNYRSSWDRLSKNLQDNRRLHPKGYSSYTSWWGNRVQNIDINRVNAIEANEETAIVDTSLKYLLNTGRSVSSNVRFFLSWDDSNQRWIISDLQ